MIEPSDIQQSHLEQKKHHGDDRDEIWGSSGVTHQNTFEQKASGWDNFIGILLVVF